MAYNQVAQISHFDCPVPAATLPSAPATFPFILPHLDTVWIEWRVPPGPNGLVGFWIGSHGQQIIPFTASGPNFIVANNESNHWDLDPDAFGWEDWELVAFNTGFLVHHVYITIGSAYPSDGGGMSAAPSLAVLSS